MTLLIDPILGNKCVDTVGWHDNINNSTCSDYIARGWCANNMLIEAMKVNSIPSLNFPELNCCGCGKRASLNLSPTARWAENATTVAGSTNGTPGSSPNMLNDPRVIDIDDTNTLYIADSRNSRVVLVSLNSTTTSVGQGPPSKVLIVDDILGIRVTRTSIYIVEPYNYRVQQWLKNLSNPTTVAGIYGVQGDSTSLTKLSEGWNVFVNNYANIFVCDTKNHRVMMFPWNSTSGTSGMIVAGTGLQGSGANELYHPADVFVNDHGVLYIADFGNDRIQKQILGASEGVIVAGTGVCGSSLSQLCMPSAVSVDLNEYIYITDAGNSRIMRWASGADVGECIAGCSDVKGKAANQLFSSNSIAFDSSGTLYVSDSGNDRIQKFQILDETTQSTTQGGTTTDSKTNLITQSTTQGGTTTDSKTDLITQSTTQGQTTTDSKTNLIKPHIFITLIVIIFVQIIFEY